jgi:hypothetical protein
MKGSERLAPLSEPLIVSDPSVFGAPLGRLCRLRVCASGQALLLHPSTNSQSGSRLLTTTCRATSPGASFW